MPHTHLQQQQQQHAPVWPQLHNNVLHTEQASPHPWHTPGQYVHHQALLMLAHCQRALPGCAYSASLILVAWQDWLFPLERECELNPNTGAHMLSLCHCTCFSLTEMQQGCWTGSQATVRIPPVRLFWIPAFAWPDPATPLSLTAAPSCQAPANHCWLCLFGPLSSQCQVVQQQLKLTPPSLLLSLQSSP